MRKEKERENGEDGGGREEVDEVERVEMRLRGGGWRRVE